MPLEAEDAAPAPSEDTSPIAVEFIIDPEEIRATHIFKIDFTNFFVESNDELLYRCGSTI